MPGHTNTAPFVPSGPPREMGYDQSSAPEANVTPDAEPTNETAAGLLSNEDNPVGGQAVGFGTHGGRAAEVLDLEDDA